MTNLDFLYIKTICLKYKVDLEKLQALAESYLAMFEEVLEKMPPVKRGWNSLKQLWILIKFLYSTHTKSLNQYRKFINYTIQTQTEMSSKELYEKFEKEIIQAIIPHLNHMKVTNKSMIYNAFLHASLSSSISDGKFFSFYYRSKL